MKKLFYLLLAFGLVSGADAKTIMPSEAEGIAAGFMAGRTFGVPRMKKAPGAAADNRAALPYYIYNCEDGGFVIVSGDDRFGEILAYSYAGSIDMTAAPDGLTGLLGLYATAYNALPAGDETAGSMMASAPSVVVEPLLGNIAWGQDAPFNSLTPVSSGTTHFYTGCVACAATQIMRYYSWPEKGTGTKTYTDPLSKNTLTADFGNTEYKWSLMPAKVPQITKAEQIQAYSTLAAHFGVAVEMQYETSGSGAYDMLVPYALRTYFGYDAGVRGHLRDYYSTSEWMSLIKDELSQGRPVFYGGSSDRGMGGHAFVLDGYDSQDFVHVNWGWYGNSNGYFRINHLDPSSLGEGGGAGGYNLSQDMVTGIRPAQAGSVRDYAVYGESRLSVDGPFGGAFTMMSFLGNIDVEPFSGRLEGALVKNGEIVATLGGDNISLGGFSSGHSGSSLVTLRNVASSVDGVLDGDYDICFVYRGSDSDVWNILRHSNGLPSRAKVKVAGGEIILGEKHVPYPDVVLHSEIETDGDLYAGGYGRALFAMENRTGDYDISTITIRLVNIDNPSVKSETDFNVHVYNQSIETVDITFPVSTQIPAGKYRVEALVIDNGKEYPFALNGHEQTVVNVLDMPSAPVLRLAATPTWQVNNSSAAVADRLAQGEFVYITGTFRNAGVPGTAKVLTRLTNTATGQTSPLVMAEATFSGGGAVSVTFARQVPHDPGTYTVDFVQVGDDYRETPIAMMSGEPLVITVDLSDNIVADVTAFEFPEKIGKEERVPFSLEAVARQTVSNTVYLRLRQLTNSKGEIVTMKSGTKFVAGEPVTISGNYRSGSSLEDGIYMIIAEAGPSSSKTTPLGNHALYAKTVAIGDVSAVDAIEAAKTTAAIWLEGRQLRVVAAEGREVASVDIHTAAGALIARDRYDLSTLTPGIYIVSATLDNGSRTTAKIAVR
ncbi:MAG: C10 family peptidase [Muribaculaceae bacterium]|nr:C10 family peptidase [Muribaculaceae bacterium]